MKSTADNNLTVATVIAFAGFWPPYVINMYRFGLHIKIQIKYSGGNDLDLEIIGAHSRIG